MSIKHGYFIFKNVGDGCLLSKYGNDTLKSPLTECAKLIRGNQSGDLFIGIYRSTWIELGFAGENLNETIGQSLLEIKPKHNGVYTLTWYDGEVDKPRFTGEAMVYENILVGSYTDAK
jgi:hypothetical protein